jgi:hypothetical protein
MEVGTRTLLSCARAPVFSLAKYVGPFKKIDIMQQEILYGSIAMDIVVLQPGESNRC